VQYLLKFNLEQYSQQAICVIILLKYKRTLPTSLLPASPKYTGRSSARPTATRSLTKKNMHQKKENLDDLTLTTKVDTLNTDDLVPKEG
jgi:hypothetical protein